MMARALYILVLAVALDIACGYSASPASVQCTRKAFVSTCTAGAAAAFFIPTEARAFDGSGSSAYSGRTPASKAELKKSYQSRVVADVKDFKALGSAIERGETEGNSWVNFFIDFKRREPDEVGRAYAALADLAGTKETSGCGILLASSFAKPGKPADNLPQVKSYNSMIKTFDPIKAAGKKGDAQKAKVAWNTASVALSNYLELVELPGELSDPIYS